MALILSSFAWGQDGYLEETRTPVKIEEVACALKASPYETAQAKWLVYKQHTLKQADETSIYL